MSTLTQFTVTGKEKDDFYGFNITGQTNQVINRVVTKNISGENDSDTKSARYFLPYICS